MIPSCRNQIIPYFLRVPYLTLKHRFFDELRYEREEIFDHSTRMELRMPVEEKFSNFN